MPSRSLARRQRHLHVLDALHLLLATSHGALLRPYLPSTLLSVRCPHPPTPATLYALDQLGAPLVQLRLPRGWPDPAPSFTARVHTEAQLAWNEEGLHAVYRIRGPFRPAADDPADKLSRMNDSRLEARASHTARQTPPWPPPFVSHLPLSSSLPYPSLALSAVRYACPSRCVALSCLCVRRVRSVCTTRSSSTVRVGRWTSRPR